MSDFDDWLGDPSVLAALDNIERQHQRGAGVPSTCAAQPPAGELMAVGGGGGGAGGQQGAQSQQHQQAGVPRQQPGASTAQQQALQNGRQPQPGQPMHQPLPHQAAHHQHQQRHQQGAAGQGMGKGAPSCSGAVPPQPSLPLTKGNNGSGGAAAVSATMGRLPLAPRSHSGPTSSSGGGSQLQSQPQSRAGPLVTVKTLLLSHGRVGFQFGYNEALLAAIKRVEGREFDSSRKVWTLELGRYEEAAKTLRSVAGFTVNVEPLPGLANTILKGSSRGRTDDRDFYSKIPETMERQMMEFQREGVKFALEKGGRVLFGDEMGLGKTVQAIAVMKCYDHLWPCLIITPSSLREAWADALHRWLGITDSHIHIVYEKRDMAIEKRRFQFLIISYDYVSKMAAELAARRFQVIVCDESHYLKNHQAKRTKETLPLLRGAQRCVLCSGTPALSRPVEIFTQMAALLAHTKLSLADFADRYCRGSPYSKFAGASNLEELHTLCTTAFMKRRLKKDVLSQLPPKLRQQIYLQLGEKEMRPVKEVQRQLEAVKVALEAAKATGEAGAVGGPKMEEKRILNDYYLKSAEAKIVSVQQYVRDLLENDEKFLIFAHHKCLLDGIEQCLRKAQKKFIRIDGSTAAHERQGLVHRFQENPDCKAAVLSIRAAGQGLTLTAAHVVVMAELSWTPGEMVQAEDRAHRIGQADSVAVQYLHARNTIDDIIWQTIQNKLDNIGQTLDGRQDRLAVSSHTNAAARLEAGQTTLSGILGGSVKGGSQPRSQPDGGSGPQKRARVEALSR